MPLEGGEKNRAYGNRAKNISVNDQSSNSIENYVNIVYSVKIYISIFYYIVVLLIVVLTVHILKIYIYCF